MRPEEALERSLVEGWRAAGGRLAARRVLASVLVLLLGASGVVVADTTTRPACLPLAELTPECQPS